jgi:hypothetical protein
LFFTGRRSSKSKSTSNNLSSISLSSSSSSSLSLSIVPLRKKTRSYRIKSSSQIVSSLSDDSLSEKFESKQSRQSRSRSAIISPEPSSAYLVRLTDQTNPIISNNLTKTITDVWKNTSSKDDDNDAENDFFYSRYSIQYIQPIKNPNKRSVPILSRNVILQRGQIDYWQNCEILSDTILTSSCENSTGSASHLISSSPIKTPTSSNGHIISITTTKRRQPSLLNKSRNIQWNIEGDGKQLRYSKIQLDSNDQLYKNKKMKSQHSTDIELPNEQVNQSNEIHEGNEKSLFI